MGVASVLAIAGVIALAAAGSIAAVAEDNTSDDGGYPIEVTVLPSTPTSTPPIPTGSSTPRTTPSSGPPSTAPSANVDEFPEGTTIGEAIYVSGLRAAYQPSIDPRAGVVRSEFVIRNVSQQSIDSFATFRLTNFLGHVLNASPRVHIMKLKPDETRVIRVDLEDAGQWAFETATYTVVPTSLVDGVLLPRLTRDTAIVFAPWLILIIGVAGLAVVIIVRIARAGRLQDAEAFG
jgi:hypothetical protein